jgi:hypothetical protein
MLSIKITVYILTTETGNILKILRAYTVYTFLYLYNSLTFGENKILTYHSPLFHLSFTLLNPTHLEVSGNLVALLT